MGGNGLILRDQPGIIQNWSVSQEWSHTPADAGIAVANIAAPNSAASSFFIALLLLF